MLPNYTSLVFLLPTPTASILIYDLQCVEHYNFQEKISFFTCGLVELLLSEEQVEPPLWMTHEVVVGLVRPPPQGLPHLPRPLHRLTDRVKLLPAFLLPLQRELDGVHHLAELGGSSRRQGKVRSKTIFLLWQ